MKTRVVKVVLDGETFYYRPEYRRWFSWRPYMVYYRDTEKEGSAVYSEFLDALNHIRIFKPEKEQVSLELER